MINRQLIWQLFFFAVVGLSATATHYVVAVTTHELSALSLYYANIIGYCSAVSISYFGHSKLTFKVQMSVAVFVRFICVSLTTLGLSELLLLYIEASLSVPHRLSMLIIVLTIPVITYLLSRLWVFRRVSA